MRCRCVSSYEIFLLFDQGSLCINHLNGLSHRGALRFDNDNLLTKFLIPGFVVYVFAHLLLVSVNLTFLIPLFDEISYI